MSLTSMLSAPDVRKRFDAELKKPSLVLRSDTFVGRENSGHAGLVGSAFDYVLRLHVVSINKSYWADEWIAEKALDRLESTVIAGKPIFSPGITRRTEDVLDQARSIVVGARAQFERCYEAENVSDQMLRSALLLARLDEFYRCGRLAERFNETDEADVRDLRRLLDVAQQLQGNHFVANDVCVLNPTFREASRLVQGADADLLIDDTLIDVKTTQRLAFTAEMFHQLVGYYVLYTLGGGVMRRVRPRPDIRNVAIYFARFGTFASVPIHSVVRPETFPAFVRWFKHRASAEPHKNGTHGVTLPSETCERGRMALLPHVPPLAQRAT